MFYAVRSVSDFIKRHWRRYLLGAVASLTENIMLVIPTYLIGKLIDAWVGGSLTVGLIRRYFLYMLLVLVVSYLAEVTWTYTFFGASHLYTHDIRRRLVRLFLRRRSCFYERFSSGDLMQRTTQDSMYVSDLLGWGVDIVVSSGSYAFVLLIMMLTQADIRLVLVSLLPYGLYFFLISKNSVKVEELWKQQEEAFTRLNDSVLEGVEGLRNIRAYAKDELFRQRFERKTSELSRMNNRLRRFVSAYGPASALASVATTLIALGAGSFFVRQGQMSLGGLIAFQVYLSGFVQPVGQFGEFFNLVQNANTSSRRLDELFQSDDRMENADGMPDHFDSLEIKDYSFRYPSAVSDNLCRIHVSLKPGQTLGIAGKTGSGKTTLIRQLQRQFPAGSGTFRFNELPLHEIRPDGFNRTVAFVEQDTMVFSGSIRDNLRFAAPEASDEALLAALNTAGFDFSAEHMQDGLDTLIGEQGITLSGGQRQRITLARALLADTDLLVLDDALSAVDAETEASILQRLAIERRGRTNILAAHRLSCLEGADEIIVLDHGSIVDRGTHQQLLSREGWYHEQALLQNMTSLPGTNDLEQGSGETAKPLQTTTSSEKGEPHT